jgi:DNA segregation ATPase FtsK/SpoIIIE-like protein
MPLSLRIYQDKQKQSSNKNTSQAQIGGIIMLSFCLIVSICLLSGGTIFGSLGVFLKNFFEGVFGIASYALAISGCILGVLLISKRHITSGRKYIKASAVLFCALVFTVHLATTAALLQSSDMYGDYLSACFDITGGSSGGGVLSAVIIYPLVRIIGVVGSYIILALIMFICVMVLTNFTLFSFFSGAKDKLQGQTKKTPIKINPSDFYYVKNKNSEKHPTGSHSNVGVIGAKGNAAAEGGVSAGAADHIADGADIYYTKPLNKNEPQSKPSNKSVDILYNNRKYFDRGETGADVFSGKEKAKSMLFNKPGQTYTNSIYAENETNENGFSGFPGVNQTYTSSFEKNTNLFGGVPNADGIGNFGNAGGGGKNISDYGHFKNKLYNFSGLPFTDSPEKRLFPSHRPPIVFHSDGENIQKDVPSQNPYGANTPEHKFLENTFGKGSLKKNKNTKPLLEDEQDDELPPIINGDDYARRRLQSETEKKLIKLSPIIDGYDNSKLKTLENIKPPQISILDDIIQIPAGKAEQLEEKPNERQETIEQSDGFIAPTNLPILKPIVRLPRAARPEQIGFQISQEPKRREFENQRVRHTRYNAPPIELLDDVEIDPSVYEEDYAKNARLLEQALSEFKISATVTDIVCGPTVTRYELEMAPGIPVKRVSSIADDIAMRLAATSGVRIEAPIPGKNLFGIEVPNTKRAVVSLKSIIESQEFKSNKHLLSFALGKDIGGYNIVQDLSDMPHLLIAGSTNTGKSVCLNSLIISLLYRYSPEDLRLILVDPKQVEFGIYNDMPHMMLKDVVTATESAISAFKWLIDEMERRYMIFKNNHVQNIIAYNNSIDLNVYEKMPRIVLIVDELSDLMSFNKSEVEQRILRLAQKARAAGIHLVLATQRPSVDVLTGTIKANLPCRIALRVISVNDSKTILDTGGPEKLIGKGDMLLKTGNMSEPLRLQGAFVSMKEVKAVVDYLKENNESRYDKTIEEKILKSDEEPDEGADFPESDKLFVEALRLVIKNGQASISMLQRSFSLGYAKAGKIIDEMEKCRYITGFEGSKARQVLITPEQFNEIFGTEE